MSDHISGPRALADPIADITDVYAFPSPERPGHHGGDDIEGGGFAATRFADKTKGLSILNVEADVIDSSDMCGDPRKNTSPDGIIFLEMSHAQ